VKDLKQFEVLKTYINGKLVAENGKSLIPVPASDAAPVNQFRCTTKKTSDFIMNATGNIPIIEALDGQLITNKISATIKTLEGNAISDTENDILKIVVVNRYADAPVSKGFIKNFGLKRGAIASSVAHDSHNIVATGADDDSICRAVNLVIKSSGGVSCVDGGDEMIVELPVGGLMSQDNGYIVAEKYAAIDRMAKNLGSKLSAPYMTLSFMALLVIPHLKLSDLGLFDGDSFSIVSQ
jgi:adenine deaminase